LGEHRQPVDESLKRDSATSQQLVQVLNVLARHGVLDERQTWDGDRVASGLDVRVTIAGNSPGVLRQLASPID
jgi:hypothetical protein